MPSSSHSSQVNAGQNAEEKMPRTDLRACIQKIGTKISQKHRLKDDIIASTLQWSLKETLYDINLNVLKKKDIGEGYISYFDDHIGYHCNTWEV